MQRWTTTVWLELSPRVDPDGQLVRFADRRDNDPSSKRPRRYRFVCAPPLSNRAACARVASRLAPDHGETVRLFVAIHLRDAMTVDARNDPELDEQRVSENDPRAIARLCDRRDQGADVVLIRGTYANCVAVIFTEAIGSTIVVAEETPHELVDGRWTPAGLDGGREAPRWMITSTRTGLALLIAWQFLVALFVGNVLQSAARVAAPIIGQTIAVPVWVMLLLSVPVAIWTGRRLLRFGWRWQRDLVAMMYRIALQRGMQDELDYWRDASTPGQTRHDDSPDDDSRPGTRA